MREDVLIILNEREPLKQQRATELEEQLRLEALSVERVKPSAVTAQVIEERAPRVLVLDYLLGDHGTALDVLQTMAGRGAVEETQVILWTDEPSVSVAVSAMKLGARDYIEIDSPRSVEKLRQAITESLREHRTTTPAAGRSRQRAAETLIYHGANSRPIPALADTVARGTPRIAVLLGPRGSGRSALGRFIHKRRPQAGALVELDVDTWPGTPEELFGGGNRQTRPPLLAHGATVLLDHTEHDTGELLSAAAKLPETRRRDDPLLLVGTADAEVARAWARLEGAVIIDIPALKDRGEDFLPILQRLQLELDGTARSELELTPETIAALQALDWPGNIRQLRAVLLEACTVRPGLSYEEQEGKKPDRLAQFLQAVEFSKERWERYSSYDSFTPQPLAARRAIDAAGGSLRIAAARLGTGVPQLRAALAGGI